MGLKIDRQVFLPIELSVGAKKPQILPLTITVV